VFKHTLFPGWDVFRSFRDGQNVPQTIVHCAGKIKQKIQVLLYSILFVYIDRIGVLTSSARAGPEEGSRLTRWRLFGKISGEPPGAVTLLRRERAKPVGNGWDKALSVME
jgi:hypothetical protein